MHPFVMVAVLAGAGTAKFSPPEEAFRIVLIVSIFTILPIAFLALRQVRLGRWGNLDASNPSERPILFTVGVGGLLGLIAYLYFSGLAPFLLRGAIVTVVLLCVSAIVTRWVKVSLHTATATFATTALVLIGSVVGYIFVPLVPALGWSRVALGRHQPIEVVVGFFFGLLAGIAVKFP
ncbi:MAG: hypothetical protein JSR82_06090 [Verrucomicrobia bacterium]|nr:hypothetical protein [Verrucomicrobiota bacterium]